MKKRYHTNISIKKTPTFPKLCVICGNPCEQIREIYGNPKVSYLGGWQWLLGGAMTLRIYGHHSCVRRLKIRLMSRSIILFIACLPLILIKIFELNPFIYFPISLVVIAAILLYQIKNPVQFEFTQVSDMLSIEFENENVANEFSRLNSVQLY